MRLTNENFNKIANLLRTNNFTQAEIAKKTGYGESTVNIVAKRIGYTKKRPKRKGKSGVSTQLCWRCKKACGLCSWSHNFTPINGWIATPTIINLSGVHPVHTYHITKCPEFEDERRK